MTGTLKTFVVFVLCISLIACMAVPSYAAGTRTEYISEIVIESGADKEAALKAAGYTVLGNLTSADKGSTFIGYKTTTDPQKAVTDIKVMNMNGKYSYSDYDVMLRKQAAAIEESMDAIAVLIEEFRTNYNAGKLTAIHCYEILNKFYNDDEETYMGDFLLDCSLEPGGREKLNNVFLQGNGEIVLAIQQALAMGSDTNDDTFIDRLEKLDYEKLVDSYTEQYGTRKAAITNIALDYDDVASGLLDTWDDFRSYLLNIERNNAVLSAETKEEMTALTAEMDEGELTNNIVDVFVYDYLASIPYGEGTMLDYFCQKSEDTDIEDIYPFVASLSEGQRANVQSISVYTLVEKAIMDTISDENTKKAFSNIINEMPTASVYSGVDRQMFNGGVALTSEATSADARSSSGGWQKPFEAAEKYYWAIGLITVASLGTYIATTARISNIISKLGHYELKNADNMMILIYNDVRVQQINAYRAGNFITRRFNYGLGVNKVSTSLINLHRVSYVLSVAAVFVNAALLTYEIHKLVADKKVEYVNIPSRMVNYISDDTAGHYVKYECSTDLSGKCADVYGFSRDEWLAVYYTRDTEAGRPVKASSLEILTGNTVPSGKKPVTLFNEGSMYNYTPKSGVPGTYLAFEEESASLAGSAFSNAKYAIFFGISLLAAFAVTFLVVTVVKKEKICKKEDQ